MGGAPLLTPAEAEGREGLVAVQGFLWARPADGQFRLCEAALESFPPQCGEPAVEVTGIDLTAVAGVDFSQNVFWAESVRARGRLDAGALVVEEVELNRQDSRTGLVYRLVVPIETTGASVDFVALLTNASGAPAEVNFTSGQSADVTLTDIETGETVYTWSASRSFDAATRREVVQPGETLRYVLNETSLGLAAGAYELRSLLTSANPPGVVQGRLVVR